MTAGPKPGLRPDGGFSFQDFAHDHAPDDVTAGPAEGQVAAQGKHMVHAVVQIVLQLLAQRQVEQPEILKII